MGLHPLPTAFDCRVDCSHCKGSGPREDPSPADQPDDVLSGSSLVLAAALSFLLPLFAALTGALLAGDQKHRQVVYALIALLAAMVVAARLVRTCFGRMTKGERC